jgi:hypothetical protein
MKKSELKSLIRSIVAEVRKSRSVNKGPTGGHPGASKWDDDAGYDVNDPKHPGYMDRVAGQADMNDRGEEDQMLGLTHDDSEPMFEEAKLGASTMKKSTDKKDNTQMGYEDKSITSTDKPTDKTEGKKLPVVQKKSNTEKDHSISNKPTPSVPSGEKKEGKALPVGGHSATKDGGMKSNGLKEEILKMIRESIDEMAKTAITLDPSGVVRGGVPIQYRIQDPESPTGWSLKGYTQKFPDGTPVEAPKNTGANYKKVGNNPNMGRPPAPGKTDTGDFDTSITATKRTEEAVEEFIKYNPDASEQEVAAVVGEKNTDETPHNLSPDAIKKAISKAKNDTSSSDVEPTEKDITAIAPKSSGKSAYDNLRARLLKAKMKPKI